MVGLRANFHRSGGGGNTRGDVAFLKRGAHTCTKLSSRECQGVGWVGRASTSSCFEGGGEVGKYSGIA